MDELDDLNFILQMVTNSQNSTDPSDVRNDSVVLCTQKDVNYFGARFIPFFYYITFLLSYLGNGLVLFILYTFEKLHTVTNVFLLNMALSNLLFASTLPLLSTYHYSEWIFGSFLCKAVSSAYFVGYYSSILFLTLMTFDRYLAVVHAVTAAKTRKKLYATVASVAVWVISILASLKEIILRDVWKSPFDGLVCEETGYSIEVINYWRLVTYYQQFLVFFMLPLCMVMYCYTSITVRILSTRLKEKCRTIKVIFLIIFTFFVCWTPYNIVSLLRAIQLSNDGNSTADSAESCEANKTLDYAFYITRNLAYLYCGISPMFYSFVGKKFQSHFRRSVGKYVPCVKRRLSISSQSTRSTSQKTTNTVNE